MKLFDFLLLNFDLCVLFQLEKVYGEIFRVLKPGGKFLSYEWLTTKEYDSNNPQHVNIIQEINYGNGLPVSRGV